MDHWGSLHFNTLCFQQNCKTGILEEITWKFVFSHIHVLAFQHGWESEQFALLKSSWIIYYSLHCKIFTHSCLLRIGLTSQTTFVCFNLRSFLQTSLVFCNFSQHEWKDLPHQNYVLSPIAFPSYVSDDAVTHLLTFTWTTVLPKGKLPVASRFARYANRVARIVRESLKRQFWHKLGTIYRWNSRSNLHGLATALRTLRCDTKKEGFDVFLVFLYANIRTNFKRMSLSLFFIAGDIIHRNRLTMSVVFFSTCNMCGQISLALSSVEH